MPICLNCENPAVYVLQHDAAGDQAFCDLHLPWFINRKKFPANVKKVTDLFKKPEPVVETPVVEETPVVVEAEESVAVKPVKKTTAKKKPADK